MSGGGHPKDNSVELQNAKFAHDDLIRQAEEAKTTKEHNRLTALANQARTGAQSSADQYFRTQGVDPSSYEGIIGSLLNSISVPQYDTNPGSYYSNVGKNAFDQALSGEHAKYGTALDKLFAPGFEYTRVADTTDDPFIQSIDQEQKNTAVTFLNNMRSRGIITDSGYAAAMKDIDRQEAGVMAKLNEYGSGALETGRQNLRDIVGRGRTAASSTTLGQQFDPNSYSTQVDKAFTDFLSNLGTTLRGKVGTANLFDTAGLPSIAGAAQGAGNAQNYSPTGLAGLASDTTEEDKNKKRTGSSGLNLDSNF